MLRSLEYMDPQGISLFNHEKMHFLQLENLIGQFPFSSPTVFNFFFADYDLPMSDADITAASPEPESEEEEVEEEKMSNDVITLSWISRFEAHPCDEVLGVHGPTRHQFVQP